MATEADRVQTLLAKLGQLEQRIQRLELRKQGGQNSSSSSSSPISQTKPSSSSDVPVKSVTASPSTIPTAPSSAATSSPQETKIVVASSEPDDADYKDWLPRQDPFGPNTELQDKLYALAQTQGLTSTVLYRCPSDYYSWRLSQRRDVLNAPSVHHLCKSIVMCNTKCSHENYDDPTNSKYYLIVVQYTARLHNDKITAAVRSQSANPPGRKQFNFRLCSPEVNDALTGYSHNAVSPLGCKEKLPVIVSDRIAKLNPSFLWLVRYELSLLLILIDWIVVVLLIVDVIGLFLLSLSLIIFLFLSLSSLYTLSSYPFVLFIVGWW